VTESGPHTRLEHLDPDEQRRVAITMSCPDTDAIPKVDGAGEVFEQDGQLLQRMHNGIVVAAGCYHGAWMTEVIRGLRGHHEPQEELVFHAIVERIARTEPRPTMIELGSWWAYYALWFARETDGSVVGLEPDPFCLEVGRRNFELNGLNARFVHGAIGDAPGAPMSFFEERTSRMTTVPSYDLASLMDAVGLEQASLVLADIQGGETPLLARARQLFEARRVRFLVLSTHHHSISGSPVTHQDARDLLESCGAHIVAEHTVGESFSGDGLIAAAFEGRDRELSVRISRARYGESLFGELERDLAESWQREERALEEVEALRTTLATYEAPLWRRAVRRVVRGVRRLVARPRR
jgi:FkbM family methyltransferase